MNNQEIIRSWKIGRNQHQIAKQYAIDSNMRLKPNEKKMTENEALQIVERAIFIYETRDWNWKKG